MIFFPSNFNYTFKFIHLKWFFKFNTNKKIHGVCIFLRLNIGCKLYQEFGTVYNFCLVFMSFNCWKTSGSFILNNITTILQNIYRQANKTNSKAFYNMALSQTDASMNVRAVLIDAKKCHKHDYTTLKSFFLDINKILTCKWKSKVSLWQLKNITNLYNLK